MKGRDVIYDIISFFLCFWT